jgi:hypothetical protein
MNLRAALPAKKLCLLACVEARGKPAGDLESTGLPNWGPEIHYPARGLAADLMGSKYSASVAFCSGAIKENRH